jgi:hypothetical protein
LVVRVYNSDDDVSAVSAAQRKSTFLSTCNVGAQASDLKGDPASKFAPIFAGKFQFSVMCDSGGWTRHPAIPPKKPKGSKANRDGRKSRAREPTRCAVNTTIYQLPGRGPFVDQLLGETAA